MAELPRCGYRGAPGQAGQPNGSLVTTSEEFATSLRQAENRLRALGLSGGQRMPRCAAISRAGWASHNTCGWMGQAPLEARLDRIHLTAELDIFGLTMNGFFPRCSRQNTASISPRPLVGTCATWRMCGHRPGAGSDVRLGNVHGGRRSQGAEVDIEVDPELVALCRLNLALHGANPRSVRQADLFRDRPTEQWDVVLANPPFSVRIDDPDALQHFSLARGRGRVVSDTLFLQAAHDRLRPGGRMAVVLPRSILTNDGYAWLRAWLLARFERRAVVSCRESSVHSVERRLGRASSCSRSTPLGLETSRLESSGPGYDTSRKTYRQTDGDDLAVLRCPCPRVDGGRSERGTRGCRRNCSARRASPTRFP